MALAPFLSCFLDRIRSRTNRLMRLEQDSGADEMALNSRSDLRKEGETFFRGQSDRAATNNPDERPFLAKKKRQIYPVRLPMEFVKLRFYVMRGCPTAWLGLTAPNTQLSSS